MSNPWISWLVQSGYVVAFAWVFACWYGKTSEVLDVESRKVVFCVILWAQLFVLIVSDGKVF